MPGSVASQRPNQRQGEPSSPPKRYKKQRPYRHIWKATRMPDNGAGEAGRLWPLPELCVPDRTDVRRWFSVCGGVLLGSVWGNLGRPFLFDTRGPFYIVEIPGFGPSPVPFPKSARSPADHAAGFLSFRGFCLGRCPAVARSLQGPFGLPGLSHHQQQRPRRSCPLRAAAFQLHH